MSDAVISKRAVRAAVRIRPAGYEQAIRDSATRETETHYILPRDKYDALCLRFRPQGVMPKPSVSLMQKAANFAASAANHIASGMPQASEEEVARRFAICQACEHFDGRACKQCGCPVVREKRFLSKLSWANEKCPVGKWGPAAAS